jgi:hypothetical protein
MTAATFLAEFVMVHVLNVLRRHQARATSKWPSNRTHGGIVGLEVVVGALLVFTILAELAQRKRRLWILCNFVSGIPEDACPLIMFGFLPDD